MRKRKGGAITPVDQTLCLQEQQQPPPPPPPLRQMVSFLLFRHRLSPYHAVSSSGNQHLQYLLPPESAACGVGKPHRWSKSAKSINFALTLTFTLTLMRILISIPGFTTSIHICSHVLNCTCLNFHAYVFDRRPAAPPRHDAFGLAILLRLANGCIHASLLFRLAPHTIRSRSFVACLRPSDVGIQWVEKGYLCCCC